MAKTEYFLSQIRYFTEKLAEDDRLALLKLLQEDIDRGIYDFTSDEKQKLLNIINQQFFNSDPIREIENLTEQLDVAFFNFQRANGVDAIVNSLKHIEDTAKILRELHIQIQNLPY